MMPTPSGDRDARSPDGDWIADQSPSPERANPPDGTILCILPGPTHEYDREAGFTRWCFKCRKRLPHDYVLIGDPPDIQSHYDPQWVNECSGCGGDHVHFPGTWSP